MAEYIEKKKLVNTLKMWLMDLENDMNKGDYGELCENKGAREAVESCICEAEEQPTADVQPIDRWISCKDEMPPIGCDVIVCYNQGYVDIGYYGISAWFIRGNSFEERAVSHWQPLPEPPKEG